MMDYSSIICKKNNPECSKCIFSSFCKSAFQSFKNNKNIKKNNKEIDFYLINSPLHICFIKKPKFQFYKNFIHLPSNLDKAFIANLRNQKQYYSFWACSLSSGRLKKLSASEKSSLVSSEFCD